jgi:hypothetical protein
MIRLQASTWIIVVAVFTCVASAFGQDVAGAKFVKAYGYKKCVELRNPSVRVVLCPIGGRVIEYTLNGKHALQLDEREPGFKPGGRRSMSAGRFDIGPEKVIPGRPLLWSGTWTPRIVGPRTAELVSPDDPATGSRLTRRFVLSSDSTQLKCTQTITNISSQTTEWCHWSRTFALGNGIVVLPVTNPSRFPNHYVMYDRQGKNINLQPSDPNIRVRDGFLEITDVPANPKLGMDSNAGWLAYAMQNNLMFVKRFQVYPNRVYNEVAGLTVSIWYPEERRVELEPIGPRERLRPGQSGSFTEEWWLLPFDFPADRRLDLKKLEKAVKEQTRPPSP